MNKVFDFIVVGSGIGGSTITHWLLKKNQKVGLIDVVDTINASSVAGCWVSPPLIRSKTHYHHFISKSFQFSTQFYQNLFKSKDLQVKYKDFNYSTGCWYYRPSHVLPNIWESIKGKTPYKLIKEITTGNEVKYFVEQSLFFNKPKTVCDMLLENDQNSINMINDRVRIIQYDNNHKLWIINGIYLAKNIILSTGNHLDLVTENYIHPFIKQLYGEVIEANIPNIHLKHSIHGDVFISPSFSPSNHIVIGSSNINDPSPNELILIRERENLLNKYMETMDSSIKPNIYSIKAGTRIYTHDSFPIVGKFVNSEISLKKDPLIIHGKVIDELEYISNKYIFTAFGGKGFLTAPYLSWLLVKSIFGEPLTNEEANYLNLSSPERLFYKWARKDSHLRVK